MYFFMAPPSGMDTITAVGMSAAERPKYSITRSWVSGTWMASMEPRYSVAALRKPSRKPSVASSLESAKKRQWVFTGPPKILGAMAWENSTTRGSWLPATNVSMSASDVESPSYTTLPSSKSLNSTTAGPDTSSEAPTTAAASEVASANTTSSMREATDVKALRSAPSGSGNTPSTSTSFLFFRASSSSAVETTAAGGPDFFVTHCTMESSVRPPP
mmetsp:Transcript_114079/g.160050  ORF Transcript_114079/g.160050 Transcript_114079/m.160050 type:complete len:216 (-) Transcript_114079:331-978(-)